MSYDPGTRHPKKTKKTPDEELSDFASKYCSPVEQFWREALVNQNAKSWAPDELQNINNPAREAELTNKTVPLMSEIAAREAELTNPARDSAATKGSGLKFDAGKEPMSLLSRRWLIGVTQVLGFGAKKYAAHNWRNGHERSRLISAAIRHILAYNEGEDVDPESGLNHLDHASCCLMFARETHETHPHLDDRWKGSKK